MYLNCAGLGERLRGLDFRGRSPRSGKDRRGGRFFCKSHRKGVLEVKGPQGLWLPLTFSAPLLGTMTGEPAADLNWDVRTDL